MNDKKIELTLGLVNAVMQYLGTRPYAEVADMIQAIREQAIPQVPMPEEASTASRSPVEAKSASGTANVLETCNARLAGFILFLRNRNIIILFSIQEKDELH